MHISQLRESKYLKKEDCGKGILLTIDRLEIANVAKAGEPEENKHILCFREDVNPMVLNSVNAQLIAKITNSEETDDWTGHQIVAYSDPSIMFAGRVIGGIRVRAPRNRPAPAVSAPAPKPQAPAQPPPKAQQEEPAPDFSDDDVPF
jgi:hypothetical protein